MYIAPIAHAEISSDLFHTDEKYGDIAPSDVRATARLRQQ